MQRIERFLTDWTMGEKGYRVVGDDGSRPQSAMPPKKLGRIAIFTVAMLVLGFTAYSFSPVSFIFIIHDR